MPSLENAHAAGMGLLGLAGQLAWPMLRTRRRILGVQFGVAACYAGHYALLGQRTGASVCMIGAVQTLVALAAGERPWLKHLSLGFIPLAVLQAFGTWNGAATLLATGACCLVMIGRMQTSLVRMRSLMLCASLLGAGYDLTVGALPALAGAILSAIVGALALRRDWLARSSGADPGAAGDLSAATA